MNYLAHAYLSFNNQPILIGNMISDFVKGSSQYNYEKQIHNGIVLHRAIDNFTDVHPAIAEAKSIFKPYYRLYSGAIVDVLLDYFLANDASIFTQASLKKFTEDCYDTLEAKLHLLPPRFVHMFTYMKMENWLYNYRATEGIEKSLRGMSRRAAYMPESQLAFDLFLKHNAQLQACYQQFLPAVKQMAKASMHQLLS